MEDQATILREFGADDARALARSIIASDAGAQHHWTETAVDTLTAIILWETLKAIDT